MLLNFFSTTDQSWIGETCLVWPWIYQAVQEVGRLVGIQSDVNHKKTCMRRSLQNLATLDYSFWIIKWVGPMSLKSTVFHKNTSKMTRTKISFVHHTAVRPQLLPHLTKLRPLVIISKLPLLVNWKFVRLFSSKLLLRKPSKKNLHTSKWRTM